MVSQFQNSTLPLHDQIQDVGPLVWILREVDASLESARLSLRKFVQEQAERSRDGGIADTSSLRAARSQLHQASGAVEIVNLAGAPSFLKALEACVAHCADHPEILSAQALSELERAMNALHEYLQSVSTGKTPQPLKLFASYASVLRITGSDRIHPADLWDYEFEWRDIQLQLVDLAPSPTVNESSVFDKAVLLLLRGNASLAALQLLPAIQNIYSKSVTKQSKSFWAIAAAVMEALSKGALHIDDHLKRSFTRMNLQVRKLNDPQADVSERLGRDLLFFAGQSAPIASERSVWLGSVLDAYGLKQQERINYAEQHYAAVDPAIFQQAQRRVNTLKQLWAELSNGDITRIKSVNEAADLVADSLSQLSNHQANELGNSLGKLVKRCTLSSDEMTADRALEVANVVLFIEASLQSGEINGSQFSDRQHSLVKRLQSSLDGQSAGPMESWMEELYRKSSEAQTMGSVVQELKVSMSTVESALDKYFRNSQDRESLAQVPSLLSQARGVLSVLGLDQAAAAVGHARGVTENWILAQDPAPIEESHLIAQNLGALSFMVDLLGYQPAAAKSMFVFDGLTHEFKSELRQVAKPTKAEKVAASDSNTTNAQIHTKIEDVASQLSATQFNDTATSTASLTSQLEAIQLDAAIADAPHLHEVASTALDALRQGHTELAANALAELPSAALAANPVPMSAATATSANVPDQDDGDDELLGIFLDEAQEVSEVGEQQVALLREAPMEQEALVTLRRSFHTLKGSSRMVGLNAFGESAWQLEQVLNTYLADTKVATPALLDLSADALSQLKVWIELIRTQPNHAQLVPQSWPASFNASAEAFKAGGTYFPIVLDDLVLESAEVNQVEAEFNELLVDESPDVQTVLPIDAAAIESATQFDQAPAQPAWDSSSATDLADLTLDLNVPSSKLSEAQTPHTTISTQPIQAEEISLDEFLTASGIPNQSDMQSAEHFLHASTPAAVSNSETLAPTAVILQHPGALPLAPPPEDEYKQVGHLRLPIGLYTVYLSEADELVRKLNTELDMWRIESRPSDHEAVVPEAAISSAHTLAGTSATVGVTAIADLGYELEAALLACQAQQHVPTTHDLAVLNSTAEEMRKLLHQFAAGFIKPADISAHDSIVALKDLWKLPKASNEIANVPATESVITNATSADIAPTTANTAPASPAVIEATEVIDIGIDIPIDDVMPAATAPHPLLDMAATAEPVAPALDTYLHLNSVQALQESLTEPHLSDPVVIQTTAPVQPQNAPLISTAASPSDIRTDENELDDTIDPDLFPIFEEEAQELLPNLAQALRSWLAAPSSFEPPKQSLRVLHTFKGSARLAGAMRLGEMAHSLETDVETVLRDVPSASNITSLVEQCDDMVARFEEIRRGEVHSLHEYEFHGDGQPAAVAVAAAAAAATVASQPTPLTEAAETILPDTVYTGTGFRLAANSAMPTQVRTQQAVRVKAGLLDRLFNQAGEVSITRARLENEIGSIKGSIGDLSDNLTRLREQLRAIELQAETQMQSRMAATKEAPDFDPLEFDRFTRFQELTRMMAESVNDVAMVQQTLNRTITTTEDDLQRQARMTRELQRDLLRTRMVEFESLSERLYRVVRQAAKELGKNVRLDIVGGQIEIDRGVLDRMAGSFEHLLRNCVAHGIELPAERTQHKKSDTGQISITLKQEGNEVSIIFSDDGAGLDFARIKEKARKLNLLDDAQANNESALAELIFAPGFSTAETISEISGRGIGMDVVKNEILSLGGRVTVATKAHEGTTFTLVLPLTTAVTQIVLLRIGSMTVGVPSSLIEIVQRLKGKELGERYHTQVHAYAGLNVDFYPMSRLLQAADSQTPDLTGDARVNPIIVVRSAAQRVAVHVDEILGNQEVVVRNLGAQLSRVPGLAGMSVLASGAVVLIYNPVALASVYGPTLRTADQALVDAEAAGTAAPVILTSPVVREPTVMVVDDSLTVRRVTQRLLQRHGYKVILAKDGMDALEVLQDADPDVMLLDIEMPRMDGFDLTRNMRSSTATAKLQKLPIVMITSRIADKHKTLAMQLGVNHYLGKPYNEEELLSLITQYTGALRTAAVA